MQASIRAFILALGILIAIGTDNPLSGPSYLSAKDSYTYGNSSGNVINEAIFVQNGDWIYFHPYNFTGDNLYRMKKDGSQVTKLPAKASVGLNIVNGWIYSSGNRMAYQRMKLDGTSKQSLGFRAERPVIVNGWIYYLDMEKVSLWKSSLDGKTKKRISNDNANNIQVLGDWIYYSNVSDGDKLYKIKTDGTGRTRLTKTSAVHFLLVNQDWVVYSYKQDLYKIRTNGTDGSILSKDNPGSMNTDGKYVYYMNNDDNHALYRIRLDGQMRKKLTDNLSTSIHIIDDWIYYKEAVEPLNMAVFQMKTDGSGKKPVQPIRDELAILFSDEERPLLFVNGKTLTAKNEQPIYHKGVLYLPVKTVYERINGKYSWNEKTQSAIVRREFDIDTSDKFTIGHTLYELKLEDGSPATPIWHNGQVYAPAKNLNVEMKITGEFLKQRVRIWNGYLSK